MAHRPRKAIANKFAKIARLRACKTPEARKSLRSMSDNWQTARTVSHAGLTATQTKAIMRG